MTAVTIKEVGTEIKRGAARGMPIVVGYFPIGFAFGVLAAEAGLSVTAAAAMSVFVFAGSSQFIAVSMIEGGAGPLTLAVTVFLVNLRHMLMSTYLAPYLGHLKRWQQAYFSYELTDESFALHCTHLKKEGVPVVSQLLAVNSSAHLAWVLSTMAGAWLGGRLAPDTRLFGLDYALPAMFIALLVFQLENKRLVCIALLAAALSTALYLAGLGHWYIILATLVAATVGALTEKEEAVKGAAKEG
jgi:4-azaleucine resistance transporter AzlC